MRKTTGGLLMGQGVVRRCLLVDEVKRPRYGERGPPKALQRAAKRTIAMTKRISRGGVFKVYCFLFVALTWMFASGSGAQTNDLSMEQQMNSIMIPSIAFKSAKGLDVLDFLIESTTAGDPEGPFQPCMGSLAGANGVLHHKRTVFALEDGTALKLPALTVDFERISLLDAIRKISERLGLTFLFQNNELVFFQNGRRIVKTEITEPLTGI